MPAADAREVGYPGFDALGLEERSAVAQAEMDEPYIYHFPDGNASIARLIVRALIPGVAPGRTMDDVVLGAVRLREARPSRRRRPPAPEQHRGRGRGRHRHGVGSATCAGPAASRRARACVLACYNMMAAHMVPEMAAEQKDALRQCVKTPMVYTKVLVRDWRAFAKLGVHEVYAPQAFHSRVKLDYPVHMGGYRSPVIAGRADVPAPRACAVHPARRACRRGISGAQAGRSCWRRPSPTSSARSARELDAMLAPGGFDAARDIAPSP